MSQKSDKDIIWDRTNIGENYPGITLPLTYSFVNEAYSHVYRGFLNIVGVNKKRIDGNSAIFDNMLGYIRGNIFYNIENWYSLLKLLPGYKQNEEYFESMLDPVVKRAPGTLLTKIGRFENIKVSIILGYKLLFFQKLHKTYEKKYLHISEEFSKFDISSLSNFELISAFKSTEKQYYEIWPITIINDFRVMILFGVLKKRAEKYKSLTNDILRGIFDTKNQPRSMLPLNEIVDLADLIRSDDDFKRLFAHDSKYITNNLDSKQYAQLKKIVEDYLEKYGQRSSNELKLEEPKFRDNPELFIDLIKYYVGLSNDELSNLSQRDKLKKALPSLHGISFFDRIIISYLRKFTSQAVYQREFYRLRRAEVFAIARKMFLELGERMVKSGDLENASDIFYLYKQEVFDYVRFHSLKSDFESLILYRKGLFSRYEKETLSQRVSTTGLPGQEQLRTINSSQNNISGNPTSGGKIKGQVIVMENLDFLSDYKGKILVTTATDPGWTVIFPLLKGIITEQGGVLSHASIIARELGLPCIVRVNNATKKFRNGQIIEMDGYKGTITTFD